MITKFKDLINHYKEHINIDSDTAWDVISSFGELIVITETVDMNKFWNIMRNIHEQVYGKHFDEVYGMWQVAQMYHIDHNGDECHTHMFSIEDAKHIYYKHFKNKKTDVTCWDLYVALNAQYHDNINVYKNWFKADSDDQLKEKVIEATKVAWFEDVDGSETKVWDYFKK